MQRVPGAGQSVLDSEWAPADGAEDAESLTEGAGACLQVPRQAGHLHREGKTPEHIGGHPCGLRPQAV